MIDILKDDTGDLRIKNDDIVLGLSDQQHQEDLILDDKGSIKEFPDAGVGAIKFLEAEDPASFLREINTQFAADGMDVKRIGFDATGKLNIEAPYK